MTHQFQLLLQQTLNHLEMSGVAIGLAWAIACPLGILVGHWHRGSFIVISIANVGRALPTLAVIALLLALVGIGFTNIVIALTILAIPPILAHAYVGIDQVDQDVVEAGRGMGMRETDLLLRVEVPLALPLIFAGLRTSVVFVIATAPLAALAGGEGLGVIIVNEPSYGLSGVIAATIWVAVLAVGADFALGFLQWLVTPNALRRSRLLGTEARLKSELDRELVAASAGR